MNEVGLKHFVTNYSPYNIFTYTKTTIFICTFSYCYIQYRLDEVMDLAQKFKVGFTGNKHFEIPRV